MTSSLASQPTPAAARPGRRSSDAAPVRRGQPQQRARPGYDKAYAVRTLQELVFGGHRYEVDALCAWALANGFTQSEVEHLPDYATRALEGRSFRLRESVGPRPGACARWEQEAHGGDM
jgi:hypothetical protein